MQIDITWKDFEIREVVTLDEKKPFGRYELVKWYDHEPIEVLKVFSGEKKSEKEISTRSCYTVAFIEWDEDEHYMDFRSVGTRFLVDYQDGLSEFVLGFINFIEPMLERQLDN